MRSLIIILAANIGFASSAAAEEVQAWDNDGHFPVSDQHMHTSYNLEQWDRISGPTTFTVKTTLHNSRAKVTFVRWSCESSVKQSITTNFQGTGAHEESFEKTFTISPSQCPGLRREIRITSNAVLPNNDRAFTTTRLCLTMGTSGTDYCGGPTVAGRHGGGAWYADTDYSVVFVDGRDVAKAQARRLVAGDIVRVKAQAGRLYAHLDPKFHDGNIGTILASDKPAGSWVTLTIPSGLAPGVHKIHLRDQRSNGEAGVYVFEFDI